MPPVWVLSVDLQTKTASFQSGMGDAAKTARKSFADIKDGAARMGADTGYSMKEARHGIMLLGEEFGVHIPRGISAFLTSLGPVGAAMESAFPFLAIIVGATLLLQHLTKLKEEGQKLTESQERFVTVANNAFNSLDEKLLNAGIRADELNGNHLAALHKKLELIDRQSMSELVHSFSEVAKAADEVFKHLQSHWYTFGIGSSGAANALEQFKTKYDKLLAMGKDKEAGDLLAGTLDSAKEVLRLQEQAQNSRMKTGPGGTTQQGDYGKYVEAVNALKKYGVGIEKEEVEAQRTLVDALRDQVEIEARIESLKKLEGDNATQSTDNDLSKDSDADYKAQAEAEKRELEYVEKEREASYQSALARLQQNEREKIDATRRGSTERLAAIDAGIQEENRYGLQETTFYRGLLTQRIELLRQMAEEEARIKADAGREEAEHSLRMGELILAAERHNMALSLGARRLRDAQVRAMELADENATYALKMAAFRKELNALDKFGKDYQNKLKQIHNKEEETTQAHENKVTGIKARATQNRDERILAAENAFESEIARGLASSITGHQTWGQMIVGIGDQVVQGMIQNAIQAILANDMTKPSDAAYAARQSWNAGMKFPFPTNLVMAPILAAGAFAAVMAFNEGGMVPGSGNQDTVPALLTPGESINSKSLTEKLSHMADGGPGNTYHLRAHFAPTVHALDAAGVDRVLTKHGDIFRRHLEGQFRKMNRG